MSIISPYMNIINHEQNPSLKHANLLNSICSVLQTHGVTFFGYTAVDPMNRAYCLGSKVDYAANYLQRALAQNDVHTFDSNLKATPQYLFWDFCQLDKDNEELYRIAREFDQSHTLTITRASDELIQCYHFSGQNHNEQLNQYYLEHLDALHLFIDYFNECLRTIPELAEVFQNPVSISKKSESLLLQPQEYAKVIPDINDISQYQAPVRFTQANQFLLTDNERECLRWLHRGKPYDMIAQIMQVSRKTVERYVRSIKEKYQCYTLFQLGEKIAENKLSELLSPIK